MMVMGRDTVTLSIISKKLDPNNHIELEDEKSVYGLGLMIFSLLGGIIP